MSKHIHPLFFFLARPMCVLGLLGAAGLAQAHEDWEGARADAHAPIGVMGDHVHKQGQWMVGYRYMPMHQEGLLDGSDSVSKQATYSSQDAGGYGYHNAPKDMDMAMHMVEIMYAPTDRWTLMAMLPYITMDMSSELHAHGDAAPVPYDMESDGLGDVALSGLFRLTPVNSVHQAILNLGLSLPTGSITEKDSMPHGHDGAPMQMRMEYPMQLGSGTYDLKPGITYTGQGERWSWGAQGIATIRTGENDEGYTLGNRTDLTGWVAYGWTPAVSTSLRLAAASWGNIDGQDKRISPTMSPAADPRAQGGDRVDVGLGANFYVPEGPLRGHRLGLEVLLPVAQRLDGPQLETDWAAVLGWQYAF
ncbi:MAG: hypothetical protein WBN85_02085 [Candidatus Macondimonas sp.]